MSTPSEDLREKLAVINFRHNVTTGLFLINFQLAVILIVLSAILKGQS